MLKSVIVFSLALLSTNLRGQGEAIIDDKDGYVNIRQSPNLNSKIIGRIYSEDIFFFNKIEGNDDWYMVDYGGQIPKLIKDMKPDQKDYYTKELNCKNNYVEVEGYVHKSHVIPLSSLLRLNPNNYKPNRENITVKNDTLLFEISVGNFDSTKHKIEKSENGCAHKIDGFQPMGLLTKLPKMETKYIKLKIRSEDIVIPKTEFSFLYELDLNRLSLLVDKKGVLYIEAGGSDGYAGYSVWWIIKNGKYLTNETFTD